MIHVNVLCEARFLVSSGVCRGLSVTCRAAPATVAASGGAVPQWILRSFSRAAVTKHHKLDGVNKRNLSSHRSRAQNLQQDASRVGSLWGAWRRIFQASLSAPVVCWQTPVFLGSKAHHPDLCPRFHVVLSLCTSVSASKSTLCRRIQSYWIRAQPKDLISTWLPL